MKKKAPQKLLNRGQLSDANDWKLLVDYDDRKLIFPPEICATNRRPDAVIWSKRSHEVILIELTVCAEEGIDAAQVRKETRYTELLEDIRATNWRANLLLWLLDPTARSRHLVSLALKPRNCASRCPQSPPAARTQSTSPTTTLPGAEVN